MMSFDLVTGNNSYDDFSINRIELSQRLKTSVDYTNDLIEKCEQRLSKVLNCKYSCVKVPVDLTVENYVNLGFTTVRSKDLYKNLTGCKEAYVFAVTIGLEVDRLINRLKITSLSEHFITDSLASAIVESYCDYVNQLILNGKKSKPRFSCGYGDFPLEYQAEILNVLSADKTLGVFLNKSLLMTPTKTITAIMGV